jgi:16S rRNA (uracil1498-N3)-methyltransferase
MRANYKLSRFFLAGDLESGMEVALPDDQAHRTRHVLRLADGDAVLLFNGRDGEWEGRLGFTKKSVTAMPLRQTRPQDPRPDLDVLFAPLKVGRLDYLVQKLVEMGAGRIQPVLTAFTQNRAIQPRKLDAWVLEAAEQCGILAIPDVAETVSLETALDGWVATRRLIFCDEDSGTQIPLDALATLPRGPLAVLIGPEGGFSDAERTMLRALPFVTAMPLGPRILRADTAAVAALAVVQAALGDWR